MCGPIQRSHIRAWRSGSCAQGICPSSHERATDLMEQLSSVGPVPHDVAADTNAAPMYFCLYHFLHFSLPHITFSLPVDNFCLQPPQFFSTYLILPQSERVLYFAVIYTLSGCMNVLCNRPIPAHPPPHPARHRTPTLPHQALHPTPPCPPQLPHPAPPGPSPTPTRPATLPAAPPSLSLPLHMPPSFSTHPLSFSTHPLLSETFSTPYSFFSTMPPSFSIPVFINPHSSHEPPPHTLTWLVGAGCEADEAPLTA